MKLWPSQTSTKKPLPSRPLKIFWWRYDYPNKLNFGDEITIDIIEKLWNIPCQWASIQDCDLIGAGSVLNMTIRDNPKNHVIDVWGSGFIAQARKIERIKLKTNRNLIFHAVRGKLSRQRLGFGKQNIAIGDPGILVNKIYSSSPKKTHKFGIVPHFTDLDNTELKELCDRDNIKLISPLQPPAQVAHDITSCQAIASSSLHGLIFADSFEVPNIYLKLSDNVIGGDYKFKDYYSSIERGLKSVTLSQLASPEKFEKTISGYQPIQDLKKLQQNLIESFPYAT